MMALRSALHSKDGAAAVEFGIFTALLAGLFIVILDFGFFTIYQRQLAESMSSAVNSAFVNRTAVNFASIPDYVRLSSNQTGATVTVVCNGQSTCVNANRTCACLSSTGTYTTAASCGATCSNSSATSGYYMTIRASSPFAAVLVPDKFLNGARIKRSVTVRLQ